MIQTILAMLLLAATPAAHTEWYAQYEQGVRAIQDGDASAAKPLLEAAVAAHHEEGLQLPTQPQQYIDYIPHLYLAIASQMTGDLERARKELALAETSGVAAKSEAGRPLLVAYQLLLRGGTRYTSYEAKPPVLTDEEFNVLRNDVLSKCDLPAGTQLKNAPWYANYELGLELERKGDYSRALTHFIDAVAQRPSPQKRARMYGMWLIDYYPYFHIARAHTRLENWQCAKNALEISQRLGEIPVDAPENTESVSLMRLVASKS